GPSSLHYKLPVAKATDQSSAASEISVFEKENADRAYLQADLPMQSKRFFYRLLSVAVLALFAIVQANAQDPDEVIRTETSLVQLNIGVVDKQGRAVTSLTKDDFAVYEDGVRQPIQYFEPVDAPFSLVLLL